MRYLLQRSERDPLWWVATDTEAQIVCRFKEGEFNETQQYTPLNDAEPAPDLAVNLAAVASGISEWLQDYHYELIHSSPTAIKHEARERIGNQVRLARETEGYTQAELGFLVGLARSHIARIEQGKYNVSVDTLAVIAHALNAKIEI